jgi:hypothetical protein
MTRDLPRPFVRTLVVATFLGSIGFVGLQPAVSWAQGAASRPPGTAAPAPENAARPPALDQMAERINYLHGRLRITQRRSRFGPVSRK